MFYDFFIESSFHMIDVCDKRSTVRKSFAVGEIFVGEKAFFLIKKKLLPKADVLSLSEVSGILGVKKTSEFLMLCHPILLTYISILSVLRESDFSIIVYCFVSSEARTGVEMEALSGVSISLLTIYDLIKMITSCLLISNIKLILKIGGKSLLYIENSFYTRFLFILFFKYKCLPFLNLKVAIVSVGTRVKRFCFLDNSGTNLCALFKKYGAVVDFYTIVDDCSGELRDYLNKLIITDFNLQLIVLVGGTGPGYCDVTSCIVEEICDKKIPGVSEMLRLFSSDYSEFSWLSNTVVGISKNKVLISIPGNSNAVFEYFFLLLPILRHLLKLVGK